MVNICKTYDEGEQFVWILYLISYIFLQLNTDFYGINKQDFIQPQ